MATFTPEQIQTRIDRAVGLTENVAGPRPSWAVAALVAQYRIDETDTQTDYFGSRGLGGLIVLAWSKHKRHLFPEMRKAALRHPQTAYLANDIYRCRVFLEKDVDDSNRAGWYCPWHSDRRPEFPSRAEAEAFIAMTPLDDPACGWRIEFESNEHRENYSMGHGNYLSVGYYDRNGWKVSKRDYALDDIK